MDLTVQGLSRTDKGSDSLSQSPPQYLHPSEGTRHPFNVLWTDLAKNK